MTTSARQRWTSYTLLTDLYELTMANAYWKTGFAERRAVFQAFFRSCPFGGGYAIAAGLGDLIEDLRHFAFSEEDLAYLAAQRGNDGGPLFAEGFLEHLRRFRFACDVDAVPEGRLVFPHEPLVRVRGPILQAQLVETLLLNRVNFQTLIATKAARVVQAAAGARVLEFGLRRAQGPDGGLSAARAALVGGCHATSNVLAGRLFDVPVSGTHAHSWVMSHEGELEAFEAWAQAMPNNAVFLVDTYDTAGGVRRAVRVARGLAERGHRMIGVRLDSGDLAALAFEARRILDEGGFPDAKIVASGDLDEHRVAALVAKGAPIDIYGVGTKMTTAADDPALGGVYKITAIEDARGRWLDRIKLSEEPGKTSVPGTQQVRRYARDGRPIGDLVWDEERGVAADAAGGGLVGRGLADPGARVDVSQADAAEDLLVPVFRAGKLVAEPERVVDVAERTHRELARLPEAYKTLEPGRAPTYPVGLEPGLYARRARLIERLEQEVRQAAQAEAEAEAAAAARGDPAPGGAR